MSAACFTPDGTMVIPAVVPDASFDRRAAAPPEWLDPERWSVPPEPGLQPIVPCDDPEDDDRAQVMRAVQTPVPPSWLAKERMPSFVDEIAREPVILPMGRARTTGDQLRLALAGVASMAFLGFAGALATLLF